ncbi:MAG: ABC transporter ATP-binding protein [Candidatus Nanopelagicales bacterium]|nr:ABC transporter ATP-binding protein [Candidatus Nanopelagicales bacterium]
MSHEGPTTTDQNGAVADPAVRVRGLSVSLGSVRALRDVSVDFPRGTITGLLGPSGSGKTTLMRTIIGTQRPGAGQVEVLGSRAGTRAARAQVGYMAQSPALYSDLTVYENLQYFAAILRCVDARIDEVIDLLDLSPRRSAMVRDLSGGETNRVSLGVALLARPGVLVLDEPTVGLDPLLRRSLWQVFRRCADDGAALVVSSHVMDEAERCDRLVLLHGGSVIFDGTRSALADQAGSGSLEDAFIALASQERS